MSNLEKNLNEVYKRNSTIFEYSPLAIVILDKKGTIVDTNNRLYEWLGYKPEEVIGKNIINIPFFRKRDISKLTANLAKRLLGNDIPPYELDFINKKDESIVTGLIYARLILDENGKAHQDLIMISNITEEKKVTEKLKNKLEELEKANSLMVDRELKMVELKEKIKKLENKK